MLVSSPDFVISLFVCYPNWRYTNGTIGLLLSQSDLVLKVPFFLWYLFVILFAGLIIHWWTFDFLVFHSAVDWTIYMFLWWFLVIYFPMTYNALQTLLFPLYFFYLFVFCFLAFCLFVCLCPCLFHWLTMHWRHYWILQISFRLCAYCCLIFLLFVHLFVPLTNYAQRALLAPLSSSQLLQGFGFVQFRGKEDTTHILLIDKKRVFQKILTKMYPLP